MRREIREGFFRSTIVGMNCKARLPLVRMVVIYVFFLLVHGGYFSLVHSLGASVVGICLVGGACLGISSAFFERFISCLTGRLSTQMGKVLLVFLFFFIYLAGYTVFFSLFVNIPVGRYLSFIGGQDDLLRAYSLYSMNWTMLFAIVHWLFWILGLGKDE